jgi:subtilisin family serine protease
VPELPHVGNDYFGISGTSMATPIVAGLAADLKQANPRLTHQDIKEILIQSADRYLPDEPNAQGAGLVDADEALQLALNWPQGRRAAQSESKPTSLPTAPAQAGPGSDGPQQGYLFI